MEMSMGMGMQMKGGYGMMEIRWAISRRRDYYGNKLKPRRRLPIYISTTPSDINPVELRELYATCNHSCHRFPDLDHNGKVVAESIDLNKLRIALSHSSVLVSVFCNLQDEDEDEDEDDDDEGGKEESLPLIGLGELLRRVVTPVSPSNSQIVGFGRAVSDFGLTASIYDVMVIPSLRGMGIGKMIVQKILRVLTNRDIYDIAALCSPNERLFFKACGFGDDILGSTTMMYARTASTYPEGDQMIKSAGRKLLLAPPPRKPFQPSKSTKF